MAKNYIFSLYDPIALKWGEGKLVYQKKEGGVVYDHPSGLPLDPQPPKDYRAFFTKHILENSDAHSADALAQMSVDALAKVYYRIIVQKLTPLL